MKDFLNMLNWAILIIDDHPLESSLLLLNDIPYKSGGGGGVHHLPVLDSLLVLTDVTFLSDMNSMSNPC